MPHIDERYLGRKPMNLLGAQLARVRYASERRCEFRFTSDADVWSHQLNATPRMPKHQPLSLDKRRPLRVKSAVDSRTTNSGLHLTPDMSLHSTN
jgi:hypothetical protein